MTVGGYITATSGFYGADTSSPVYLPQGAYFYYGSGQMSYMASATDGTALYFYALNQVAMTVGRSTQAVGGQLHGQWLANGIFTYSDRRLKSDITPLRKTLKGRASLPLAESESEADTRDGALWVLRQLRPVSYHLKKGPDAKYMHFGFIADELEQSLPEVIRTVESKEEATSFRSVAYQDLIAVLTAIAKSVQQEIEDLQDTVNGTQIGLHQEQEEMKKTIDTFQAKLHDLAHERRQQDELRSTIDELRQQMDQMHTQLSETKESEDSLISTIASELEQMRQRKGKRDMEDRVHPQTIPEERRSLRG